MALKCAKKASANWRKLFLHDESRVSYQAATVPSVRDSVPPARIPFASRQMI